MWKPKEIIIHENAAEDPITQHFLNQCPEASIVYVDNGRSDNIVNASKILNHGDPEIKSIVAGKQVVYISTGGTIVDQFTMPDNRIICPHFDRLKLASNGCHYHCDWCYLKFTFRANAPFIRIKVGYDKIKKQLLKRLSKANAPIMFNSGEMADSLALDHLTRAGKQFIPWFGNTSNGYLFMLTKSDNVDDILDLDHKGHTIIAWSMNNEMISRHFEIGAPTFNRRLNAAIKVQNAGYPLRIRLDPIVPFDGWQDAYAATVRSIFSKVAPERITLGTLRFEKGFYGRKNTYFTTGNFLPNMVNDMEPMFEPKLFDGDKTLKAGKYSFTEQKRIEIFNFVINEIRKYSDCKIALCKESATVWQATGLDTLRFSCVCQLDSTNMAGRII